MSIYNKLNAPSRKLTSGLKTIINFIAEAGESKIQRLMAFSIHLKSGNYHPPTDGVVVNHRPPDIWDVYHADEFNAEFPDRYYVVWGEKDFELAIRVAAIHAGPLNLSKIYIRSHVEPDLAVVNLIANAAKRRRKTVLYLVLSWLGV